GGDLLVAVPVARQQVVDGLADVADQFHQAKMIRLVVLVSGQFVAELDDALTAATKAVDERPLDATGEETAEGHAARPVVAAKRLLELEIGLVGEVVAPLGIVASKAGGQTADDFLTVVPKLLAQLAGAVALGASLLDFADHVFDADHAKTPGNPPRTPFG